MWQVIRYVGENPANGNVVLTGIETFLEAINIAGGLDAAFRNDGLKFVAVSGDPNPRIR